MLFSGTVFIILFLPLLLLLYFLCPKKYLAGRNALLILFSLFFYSFGGLRYTALLLISTTVNYLGALAISHFTNPRSRRIFLHLSVTANLGMLGYFKYAAFVVEIANSVGFSLTVPNIVLPLGISFYTFQGMSYLFDVSSGRTKIQKNPFLVLLYITLFPQLVAGPIVNYSDVETELCARESTIEGFSEGVTRFMFGFGKKMILSGAMGEIADNVWTIPLTELPGTAAWVGAFAYFFQIYFDFSGYSDMAIGLGRIFGFHFPENFNYPYIADSVTDFWRRWHITLSRWFRDYVYIPLGGNRCGKAKQIRNLLIVWFLTGLWHGANWTFIAWGLYYALFLLLEKFLFRDILPKIPKLFRQFGTLFIVLVGWVFFRSASLTNAFVYLKTMFMGGAVTAGQAEYFLRQYWIEWLFCIIASMPVLPWLRNKLGTKLYLPEKIAAWGIFAYSYVKLVTGSFNPFIYFHF